MVKMQKENFNENEERTAFHLKRSARMAELIPFAYAAFAVSFGDYRPASLAILAVGAVVFYLRRRPQIITDDKGLFYRSFFQMKRIKWEEIYSIKLSKLTGYSIFWGDTSKNRMRTFRLQWRPKKALKIWKEIEGFTDLLKIVLEKSIDAEVDPKVLEFFNAPDKKKMIRYGWGFGSFFLLLLMAGVYMLLKLVHGAETLGYNHIFLIAFLPLLGGLSGMFFSRFLYIWDEGDKWSDLGLLYGLFTYSPILHVIILFSYSLAVWSVVVTTTFLAFSMLIFCFPTLSHGKIAGLLLVFVLLGGTGGKICLYNPHVERSALKQLDHFYCSSIGWFPDAQRIWLTGRETIFYADDGSDSNDDSEDLVILDTESGRIVHRMPVDTILPSFSFHWSPEGTLLALLEFPRNNDRMLSLVDTVSFEKTPLLEAEGILLHEYGCWNMKGNKLVGVHRNEKSDNEESRIVFLIDVTSGDVSELVEMACIDAVFWLSDGNIGILHKEPKQMGDGVKRRRLYEYQVSRLDPKNGEKKALYASGKYHKAAYVSPRGKYMLLRTKDDQPLIADLTGGREALLDERLTDSHFLYEGGWAPDGSAIFLPVKREGKKEYLIYEPGPAKISVLPSGFINRVISRCGGLKHFLGYNDDHSVYPPFWLLSRGETEAVEVARGGLLSLLLWDWTASVSPDGSRVIHYGLSFSLKNDSVNVDTTIYMSEIRKDNF